MFQRLYLFGSFYQQNLCYCYALFNENLFPFVVNPKLTKSHIPFTSQVLAWFSPSAGFTSSLSSSEPFPDSFSSIVPSFDPILSTLACVLDPPSIVPFSIVSIPHFAPASTEIPISNSTVTPVSEFESNDPDPVVPST